MAKNKTVNELTFGWGVVCFDLQNVDTKNTKYKKWFKKTDAAFEQGSGIYNIFAVISKGNLGLFGWKLSNGKINKLPFEITSNEMSGLKITNYSDGYGGKGVRIKFVEKNYGFKINIGIINKKIKQLDLVNKVSDLLSV